MSKKTKILIIEDEKHIAEGLVFNLRLAGHDCIHGESGEIGLELWRSEKPDLIILDLMLPQMDGHTVLAKIRKVDEKLPILILSAKENSKDKIEALSLGAFDYLTKPFHLDELILRVKGMIKRSNWPTHEEIENNEKDYIFGKNKFEAKNLKAFHQENEISLTEQEAKLLKIFLENPGKILNREDLLKMAWGYTDSTNTRTLDNFIVRLRKYFEDDPKNPMHFLSKRGKGYLFRVDYFKADK